MPPSPRRRTMRYRPIDSGTARSAGAKMARASAAGLCKKSGVLWALASHSSSSSTAARSTASPAHCSSRKARRRYGSRSSACKNSALTVSRDDMQAIEPQRTQRTQRESEYDSLDSFLEQANVKVDQQTNTEAG